jgi:hypothetical protein
MLKSEFDDHQPVTPIAELASTEEAVAEEDGALVLELEDGVEEGLGVARAL